MSRIILASKSPHRATLLENAGIAFDAMAAEIDERAVEEPLLQSGLDGTDIAGVLAEAKAMDVAGKNAGAFVIGSDQTLSLDGKLMHKPADMDEAARRLLELSSRTHVLASAVAIVRDGETLWRMTDTARITFRSLEPGFVGRYLADAGDVALTSVGAYQIEGRGVQLFEKVEGDFFTIIGMPLLPLIQKLRELGLVEG